MNIQEIKKVFISILHFKTSNYNSGNYYIRYLKYMLDLATINIKYKYPLYILCQSKL